MRRVLLVFVVAVGVCLILYGRASALPFINGDFETGDLTGYFTEDDNGVPNPDVGVGIDGGTGNHFGSIAPSGASWLNTLGQNFVVPATPSVLSFDFAFSTQASPALVNGFSDSFYVSLYTYTLFDDEFLDYLDILVVDAYGVLTDASATGLIISYDPTIPIPGFIPCDQGTTFYGHINLALPGFVLGEDANLYFDLLDNLADFDSIAAVDNLSFASAPAIPEPGTLLLIGSGLIGLGRMIKKRS